MVLSVQYLRGLAAVMVLLEHTAGKSAQYSSNLLSGWHVGGAGVDLFFLISGFIMCHTTEHKHQQAGASRQFLWRRITRIIPLYWLVTCLALCIYLIAPERINSNSGGTDLIASYFLLPSEQVYLVSNGWTLRYEFLFYAIFMLGLWLSRGLGRSLVIALIITFVAAGQLLSANGIWGRFVSDPLLLEFTMGIGLYYYYHSLSKLSPILSTCLLGVGIGSLMAVNAGIHSGIRIIDFGIPMVFVMAGALGLEPLLRQKPIQLLKVIGDSSYAMYLIHPFALAGSAMLLGKLGLSYAAGGSLFVLVLLLGSLLLGYWLYRYVETPMTQRLHSSLFKKTLKPQTG